MTSGLFDKYQFGVKHIANITAGMLRFGRSIPPVPVCVLHPPLDMLRACSVRQCDVTVSYQLLVM